MSLLGTAIIAYMLIQANSVNTWDIIWVLFGLSLIGVDVAGLFYLG